jgi:superfamily II DNA or RNA helicase
MKTELFDYQKRLVSAIIKDYNEGKSCTVLAAGCGSGKTIMTLAFCEEILLESPQLRILSLTHGQTILRTNFIDNIREHLPKLTYSVVDSSKKLNDAQDAQVYVGLPQTISKSDCTNRFDIIIVDEAHEFYFASMVQKIIQQSKPKFVLLLTGSPAKFIKEKYPIHPISLFELFELGRICSPVVELAQTMYKYTFDDYNSNDELNSNFAFNGKQTDATLDSLLHEIVRILSSWTRTKPAQRNFYDVASDMTFGWKKAFGILGKTMVVCRSQLQAGQVQGYFSERGFDVALSTSDVDTDSSEIERFKSEENCKVLVVVDRGILGFNMPTLLNIVDLSGSLNPDVMFQLFARLVRKHPRNKEKLFLKVVPQELESYSYVLMNFVVALSDPELYGTYNGEYRAFKLPILREASAVLKQRLIHDDVSKRRSGDSSIKYKFPPLPSIDVMNRLLHKGGNPLESFAYTSVEDFRRQFKGFKWHSKYTSLVGDASY